MKYTVPPSMEEELFLKVSISLFAFWLKTLYAAKADSASDFTCVCGVTGITGGFIGVTGITGLLIGFIELSCNCLILYSTLSSLSEMTFSLWFINPKSLLVDCRVKRGLVVIPPIIAIAIIILFIF